MRITDTHVYFYGKTVFSNWHTSKNQIIEKSKGIPFDSSEQAFMYLKAVFFNDEDAALKICGAINPKIAKQLGRGVKNYNDIGWSRVCFSLMKLVLKAKFEQNPQFLKELLDTGEKILVEASPYDTVWGRRTPSH